MLQVLKVVNSGKGAEEVIQEIGALGKGLVESHSILQASTILKKSGPYSQLSKWLTDMARTLPELLQDITEQGWSYMGWATRFKWQQAYPVESFPSGPRFQDLAAGDQLLVFQHVVHSSGAVKSNVRVFSEALGDSGMAIALLTLGSLVYDAALMGGQVIEPLSGSIKVQNSTLQTEVDENLEISAHISTPLVSQEMPGTLRVLGSDIYGFLLGTQQGAKQDAVFDLVLDALSMRCPDALISGTFQALILPLSAPLTSSLRPPLQRIW